MIDLMEQVAKTLQEEVAQPGGRHALPPAVVTFDSGRELRDGSYWTGRDAALAFERHAGQLARRWDERRWAFGTRAVMLEEADHVKLRPVDRDCPAQGDEVEVIWVLGVDLDEGATVGRVRLGAPPGVEHQALEVIEERTAMLPGVTPGFEVLLEVLG